MREPLDTRCLLEIERNGYVIVSAVWTPGEVVQVVRELTAALEHAPDAAGSLRTKAGQLYAARNMLNLWPPAVDLWQRGPLISLLTRVLGTQFGLVRGLYFNKPPDQSWSLPWHQDLAIAVRNNRLPSSQFRNPTTKSGVAHVEAPRSLLARMLTLRLHLDDATPENGPLRVMPGSHAVTCVPDALASGQPILTNAGDVLAMRPLLFHASGGSVPGTHQHRRVLHWEFAADQQLPDGYAWNWFYPPVACV